MVLLVHWRSRLDLWDCLSLSGMRTGRPIRKGPPCEACLLVPAQLARHVNIAFSREYLGGLATREGGGRTWGGVEGRAFVHR